MLKRSNIREKRRQRIRGKIFGTEERPRLAVFRSDKHIFAQMIDDEKKQTLVAFSDLNLEKKELKGLTKTQKAALVGQKLAKKAKEQGIKKAVFDRGGFLYHGRVAALAKNCREAGLIF